MRLDLARRVAYYRLCRATTSRSVDPPLEQLPRPSILACWHSSVALLFLYSPDPSLHCFVSDLPEAHTQAELLGHLGFAVVPRPNMQGSVRAARRLLQGGSRLLVAVDGPHGPSREVKRGAMYLASAVQCPIVPVVARSTPELLLPGWDRPGAPILYSRVAATFGKAIEPPADRLGRNVKLRELQDELDRLDLSASSPDCPVGRRAVASISTPALALAGIRPARVGWERVGHSPWARCPRR
jgi:lysophospholipid acyltransferase (LPLAT)-like uncharacterized protein